MVRLLVLCLLIFRWYDLVAQVGETDSLSRAQDSVRTAWEERMKANQKQHRVYEKMFAANPKQAIDSVVSAKNQENMERGLKRLEQYSGSTRPDTLRVLDLSYANLNRIPDFVYKAKNMEVLILDNNHIRRLPRQLNDLSKLKRIYWRENNLEDFWWIRIQKIEGLERLDMGNNTLTRLPNGVRNLKGLKELVLDENLFSAVPVSRLKRADFIEQVSFSKIPTLRITKNSYEKLPFIKVFKANNCGFESVDSSFYKMSGLVELQLQENNLTKLPEGISALANLEKVSF